MNGDGMYDRQPSKLCQDLLELEKNFKDNLMLLRTKDAEIDRLDQIAKSLKNNLINQDAEILALRSRISALEMDVSRSEQERSKDKLLFRQNEKKYIQSINELRRSVESGELAFRNEIERKEMHWEEDKRREIKEMQSKHDALVAELRQKQICNEEKLKTRLQQTLDENLTLVEKSRQLENKYVSESSVFRSELKSLQAIVTRSETIVDQLQKENQQIRGELALKHAINNKLKDQLQRDELKINTLSERCKQIEQENAIIGQRIKEERANSQRNYRQVVEKLTAENEKLIVEVKELEKSSAKISRQNDVLQEIIKAMRKERIVDDGGGGDAQTDAERRLERLEILVQKLKRSLMGIAVTGDGIENALKGQLNPVGQLLTMVSFIITIGQWPKAEDILKQAVVSLNVTAMNVAMLVVKNTESDTGAFFSDGQ